MIGKAALDDMIPRAADLATSFLVLFKELDTMNLQIEPANRNFERISAGLSATLAEFRSLVRGIEQSPLHGFSDPGFRRLVAHLNASSRQLSAAFRRAAERARKAGDDARPALERLSARADTIKAVLADIQGRIDESGGGLLIRAQRDSAITRHLHEAQAQLDTLIQETRKNPLRFWF